MVKGWMKLSTTEGNIKGLQKVMNYFHTHGDDFVLEHIGQYAALAGAMNSAIRLHMDRERLDHDKKIAAARLAMDQEKFELEKTLWKETQARLDAMERTMKGQ